MTGQLHSTRGSCVRGHLDVQQLKEIVSEDTCPKGLRAVADKCTWQAGVKTRFFPWQLGVSTAKTCGMCCMFCNYFVLSIN